MFYDKFLRLCEEKGVSPSAACMAMGVSDGTWRRWRDGSSPRGVNLQKVCKYFNVSPSTMLDDGDEIVYLPEDESIRARQEAFDRAEMRVLFDAARDVPASKIYEVVAMSDILPYVHKQLF